MFGNLYNCFPVSDIPKSPDGFKIIAGRFGLSSSLPSNLFLFFKYSTALSYVDIIEYLNLGFRYFEK